MSTTNDYRRLRLSGFTKEALITRLIQSEQSLAEARNALNEVISECFTNMDCHHGEQDSHIDPDECGDIDDCIGCTITQICQRALEARAAIPENGAREAK
jgi:hypothetical protein